MKTLVIKSTAITSFLLFLAFMVNAQVAEQNREIGEFTGIHQTTSADVYISRGDTYTVRVKADEDIIDKLTTEVRDGVLHIGTEKGGWRNVRVMEVYITMPRLDVLKNSGSGDISVKGDMPGNNLEIGINGSGDLDAAFDVKNIEINISGSGDVSFSGVRGNMNVKISGSGDIDGKELVLDECTITGYGSGDLEISGKAAVFIANISGSGDVNAYRLTAADVTVKCNGSGDVVVHAAEKVKAMLNGSGDLTYYGSPEYVDVEANGSGEVYRR
jgi:hypothetical protein